MNNFSILVLKKLNDYNNVTINKMLIHTQLKLSKHGIQLIIPEQNPAEDPDVLTNISPELVVSIGGDGTAIYAAKYACRHSLALYAYHNGHLGFLADRDIKNLSSDIINFCESYNGDKERESVYTNRNTLQLYTNGDKPTDHKYPKLPAAINEYVLSARYSDTIIELDMYIDDRFAGKHIGNGVVVSTPTGSTAYALSLGGPLIDPNSHVVQISFIAPFTLTARPMIVSATSRIRFEPISERYDSPIVIKCDGQEVIETVKSITIASWKKLAILHPLEWSFYDVLTNKLKWNSR